MLLHVPGRAEARPSVSLDPPNPERSVFYPNFNFALVGSLLILSWPERIVEMQGPFLPMQPHLRKSFCPEWKLPSFARHARTEIIQQQSAVLFPCADKIKSPVSRFRVRGQRQDGTNGTDVHGVPKQITSREIAAIQFDLPLARPITLQSPTQFFHVAPHCFCF